MPDSPENQPGGRETEDSTIRLPETGHRTGLPTNIGGYTIRRVIASGGMGTVYEALQENPRRSVAIKVMKPEIFSAAGLQRFKYEAQMLARLRHPCVAQVYEAGQHIDDDSEIPYFAMEYIPNAKPITHYATEKRLPLREKLRLFAMVCDGVHHGHQRSIIHRDLKPSNILIDSDGHPKIIDFGVARATDPDMAAAGQTEVGQLVGTLQYMSPEQFEADPNDIDTRSDVYSLGIVLYELLSGRLPYTLEGTPLHLAATLVREAQPTPLRELDGSIDADLQTIVSRALAKDRDQRYQSAFGLREDINRFLAGAAIAARPPSFRYQVRVLARRNKAWIGAGVAVILALLAGGIVSASMYFRAEAERHEAELQALRSQKAIAFVSDALLELWPRTWGHEPTVDDLIASMRERVDVSFADEPEIAAQIHLTLGWASIPLEQYDKFEAHCQSAVALRRESFGASAPQTIESLHDLARAQSILGDYVAAIGTFEAIVEALGTAQDVNPADVLDAREVLAQALETADRDAEARDLMLEIASRRDEIAGPDDRDTLSSRQFLSWILLKLGKSDDALVLAQDAYDRSVQAYGLLDETTKGARSTLAACYIVHGRVEDAKALFDQPLPNEIGITRSYQGSTRIAREGPQILIMWETWCPYSQRVVPDLENVFRRYQDLGLHVAGLTRVTRSSSNDRVESFIRDQQLSFPILQEDGTAWSYFEASGTPYTVLLLDGQVVWRGTTGTSGAISKLLAKELIEAHRTNRG